MQEKTKNIIIVISFAAIIIMVFFINIIGKDKLVSITERRKLAQFPDITLEKVLDGDVSKKIEEYVTDQFMFRDFFREIKSFFSINILKQKDNNNLFEKDGAIYKLEYPLKEENIRKSASRINEIYNQYLKDANVYYAIIPDKNYYLENDDHLKIDYNELIKIMKEELNNIEYIDIWDSLELKDYYKTDLHWKQENLYKVANDIRISMNLENITANNYEINDFGEFYGAYYGQLGLKVEPDRICTLTNNVIENCITYNLETNKYGKIYDKNTSADKYDVYLSGATPLITIENPSANTEKELLLFRDSFGSSLAPLLVENYSKVTLIDTRYISSKILDKYIEFKDQDVLFLYSTLILNQNVLK